MIDLKLLTEQPEKTKKAIYKKTHYKGDLDSIIKMNQERLTLMREIETLKASQNRISKEIPKATTEAKEKLLTESKQTKEQLKELEPKLDALKAKLDSELIMVPNPTLDSVPEGKDESGNVVVKTVGKKPEFDFEPLDHITIGKKHDLIDMETATSMAGARFYYLKNEAVMLEFALIQFIMEKLMKKGFKPVIPPVLVKEKAMYATGFFPADRNEIYQVNPKTTENPENDDLYLVGTSEVPLCMLHADQILPAEKLPLRYMGFSTCFRREAGSYGKDTHGIIRVHQFDKIEMFSFCDPSKSEAEHELIRSMEEEIMTDLGFHFQVLNMCGGDLGNPAAKKYDIEVWIPTQGKFRELTSCSNCTDYQARRANIRLTNGKENVTLHTLNGTAVAVARTLVAILENYQQKDGTVAIPKVLIPYMHGKTFIGK
ncbi:MAG: serine--tRNA ligase [Candidatus Gracilibacteria bacterium]|jgi:seryl-tRNA synthetase